MSLDWFDLRYRIALGREREGANFTADDFPKLMESGRIAHCSTSGRLFDWWNVEVTARYSDCSVFRCPACKGTHDDRPSWHGGPDDRMGFSILRAPEDKR